jgi:hypothetical protein
MNCWNSAFNARGSRLIIVVVQLGAMKIYVAAVEAAREKGKTGWNSVYHQDWWFSEFHPSLNGSVRFCRFFLNLTLHMTKLRVLVLCFSYFTDNSNTVTTKWWNFVTRLDDLNERRIWFDLFISQKQPGKERHVSLSSCHWQIGLKLNPK